uniref:Uncharacterized protein n=1 Tax=Rhizophagus irregularis (strain DAOM 181602 / DAOM 197198 / MUCL 43194) TaxID=747089 RepID=U9TC56_RHIID
MAREVACMMSIELGEIIFFMPYSYHLNWEEFSLFVDGDKKIISSKVHRIEISGMLSHSHD